MNKTEPLVCICVPVYNAAGTIFKTISSLINQNYSNYIIKVVDNVSTDNTLEIVESFNDTRIIVIRNSINVGGEGNFNRCISLMEGKYSAIFHADDVYEPGMLTEQVQFLDANANAGAVFTSANIIDSGDVICGVIRKPKSLLKLNKEIYTFNDVFRSILKNSNFLICPSVMVRTEIYTNVIGAWNSAKFKSSSDLDVWLRILQFSGVGYINKPLMQYRISKGQGTEAVRNSVDSADFFLVVEDYLKKDSVKVILCSDDYVNYSILKQRDLMMRVVNLIVAREDSSKVKCLLTEYSKNIVVKDLFRSRVAFYPYPVFIAVRFLILLRLESLGARIFSFFKEVLKK